MSRLQRFFLRITGTRRLIFCIVLLYDLYLYKQMIDAGMIPFVLIAVIGGISTGCVAALLLRSAPDRLATLLDVTGMGVMGVFVVSQCFGRLFPGWIYLLAHVLLCFWFTAMFWYASRPLGVEDYLQYPLEAESAED